MAHACMTGHAQMAWSKCETYSVTYGRMQACVVLEVWDWKVLLY